MIKVILKTKDKNIVGFQVSGHAGYAEYGKDIVCSAVSVLSINAINTLEEILKLKEEIKYYLEDNFIDLDLVTDKLDDKKMHDTQLTLRSFEMGITSVLKEYQESVEIYYKEV